MTPESNEPLLTIKVELRQQVIPKALLDELLSTPKRARAERIRNLVITGFMAERTLQGQMDGAHEGDDEGHAKPPLPRFPPRQRARERPDRKPARVAPAPAPIAPALDTNELHDLFSGDFVT